MVFHKDKRVIDLDNDGNVSEKELSNSDHLLELELREEKANTQRRMAWVSLYSMIGFTIILFSPIISNERVNSLADLLGLFYIAQAGIVGAYFGFTSWMSNTKIR